MDKPSSILILQKRKQRHREVKPLSQGHTAVGSRARSGLNRQHLFSSALSLHILHQVPAFLQSCQGQMTKSQWAVAKWVSESHPHPLLTLNIQEERHLSGILLTGSWNQEAASEELLKLLWPCHWGMLKSWLKTEAHPVCLGERPNSCSSNTSSQGATAPGPHQKEQERARS